MSDLTKPEEHWAEMASKSRKAVEDLQDFSRDRAIVWAADHIAELESREVTDEQIDRVWQLYIGMAVPYMSEDDKRRERAKVRAALQEREKG